MSRSPNASSAVRRLHAKASPLCLEAKLGTFACLVGECELCCREMVRFLLLEASQCSTARVAQSWVSASLPRCDSFPSSDVEIQANSLSPSAPSARLAGNAKRSRSGPPLRRRRGPLTAWASCCPLRSSMRAPPRSDWRKWTRGDSHETRWSSKPSRPRDPFGGVCSGAAMKRSRLSCQVRGPGRAFRRTPRAVESVSA